MILKQNGPSLHVTNSIEDINCTSVRAQMASFNRRRNAKRKDSYGRIIPLFLDTFLGNWLMKQRTDIERQFNILKDKGLKHSRLFGFNRYLLHV